jgi:hypothetical protein
MKRILIIIGLVCFSLLSGGQTLTWSNYIDLDGTDTTWAIHYDSKYAKLTRQVPDTLTGYRIQSGEFGEGQTYAGYGWSVDIWSQNITDTITIDFGSANHTYASGKGYIRKGFNGIVSDSLPFTYIAADNQDIRIRYDTVLDSIVNDTSFHITIYGMDAWPWENIQEDVSGIENDTTGILGFDWLLYKM